MQYIPLEACKDRYLYKISSRNLSLGVFNEKEKGFVGIRENFGSFLFTEYHYDTGPPYGTVHPLEELCQVPEGMSIDEQVGGTVDDKTGKPVAFDRPVKEGGRGWYFTETGESAQGIRPVIHGNSALFDWLKAWEEQHRNPRADEAS